VSAVSAAQSKRRKQSERCSRSGAVAAVQSERCSRSGAAVVVRSPVAAAVAIGAVVAESAVVAAAQAAPTSRSQWRRVAFAVIAAARRAAQSR